MVGGEVPPSVFLLKNVVPPAQKLTKSNLFAKSNPEKLHFLRDVLYRLHILVKNYGGAKPYVSPKLTIKLRSNLFAKAILEIFIF